MNTEPGSAERFSIVFHQMTPSPAVKARAQQLLDRLVRAYPMIMRGTMIIEGRHHHHRQGNVYHVAIHAHLPNGDINVSHDPELNHAHEDIYVAMRDACNAAKKQLAVVTKLRKGAGLRHARARLDGNPRNERRWGE
jgi:ribosome-associated translation inhibitor RaiA